MPTIGAPRRSSAVNCRPATRRMCIAPMYPGLTERYQIAGGMFGFSAMPTGMAVMS